MLLSSVLAGAVPLSEIQLKPPKWWTDRGVTLLYGHRAVSIDHDARRVRLAAGATLPYAHLVLATGSEPIRLTVPGNDLPGVLTFRDLGDVAELQAAAVKGTSAVVIGGGLLGLEAAYGLARAGVKVGIVHLMDRLMERQLDARSAAMLKRAVEAEGIRVLLEVATARFIGHGRVEGVELKDGRVLQRARWPNGSRAVMRAISAVSTPPISRFPAFTSSRPATSSAPRTELIVFSDQGLGTYRKLVIAGGCLVGAVLYGDTADSLWYLDLIRSGIAIDFFREDLIFGRALAERQAA